VNVAEPSKSFFAVHEGHGKVEQNQVEPLWLLPETFQTFETRLDDGDFITGFGENAVGQNARCGLVIDHEDTPRPDGQRAPIGFIG
jgi:hypothetical protein